MVPECLIVRNFMCYREGVPPLDLRGISIACLAGNNGAGKSALLDAITWALWGETRLRGDKDVLALGAVEVMVELIFSVAGQRYRVIRRHMSAGRGKSSISPLEFQVESELGWRTLTGATKTATQQAITATLRMTHDLFSHSAFLRQGRADAFTSSTPNARKTILGEILGLADYDAYESRAKTHVVRLEAGIQAHEGRLAVLAGIAAQRDQHAALVETATARRDEAEQRLAQLRNDLEDAQEAVRSLEDARRRLGGLQADLERLQRERIQRIGELEQTQQRIAGWSALLARRAEIGAGTLQLQAAIAEHGRLEAVRERYEQLRVAVDATRRDVLLEQHDHATAVARLEERLAQLRERAAHAPRLRHEIAELQERLEPLRTLDGQREQLRAQRGVLQQQRADHHRLELRRAELRHAIDARAQMLHAERDALLQRIHQAEERLRGETALEHAERAAGDAIARGQEHVQQQAAVRAALERLASERGELDAHQTRIKHEGEEARARRQALDAAPAGQVPICPHCGMPLDEANRLRLLAGYDGALARLRTTYVELRDARQQLDAAQQEQQARLRAIEQQAEELNRRRTELAQIRQARHELGELRAQLDQRERLRLAEIDGLLSRREFEQSARSELITIEARIGERGSIAALDQALQRINDDLERIDAAIAARSALALELQAHEAALHEISRNDPALFEVECDLDARRRAWDLGQVAAAPRAALIDLERQLAPLADVPLLLAAARSAMHQLAHWAEEARQLSEAEGALAREQPQAQSQRDALARHDAELAAIETLLTQLRQTSHTLRDMPARRDALSRDVRRCSDDLAVWQRDVGEHRARLTASETAAVDHATALRERSELALRRQRFQTLVRAFGKKGIQAMLIERALPEIETEANALLRTMSDNQLQVQFVTQHAGANDQVIESLDIKISDQMGTRDYAAYSGGEAFRIDFAIRIALSKLLARRAGAHLETLFIDEGFGSQDAQGRDRLIEAITSVQHEFRRILVVTHIQELRDMFPVHIEITKTAEGSRWQIV
jgi:exonuclease SbcC